MGFLRSRPIILLVAVFAIGGGCILPVAVRHRTSCRNKVPFPATQDPAAEIPAGGWPVLINCASVPQNTIVILPGFLQVPAGGIGEEIPVCFPEAPLTKVMQLVGFALPHEHDGKPAAALPAAAAGRGGRRNSGFHPVLMESGRQKKVRISDFSPK